MRWPWQWRTKPGFVWVNHKELIELLKNALLVADQTIPALVARADAAEAKLADHVRAEVLRDQARLILETCRVRLSPLTSRALLADLPLTDDGDLDEVAFAGSVFDATADVIRFVRNQIGQTT